jgi:hypothetical protein
MVGLNAMFNRWRRKRRLPLEPLDTTKADWSAR